MFVNTLNGNGATVPRHNEIKDRLAKNNLQAARHSAMRQQLIPLSPFYFLSQPQGKHRHQSQQPRHSALGAGWGNGYSAYGGYGVGRELPLICRIYYTKKIRFLCKNRIFNILWVLRKGRDSNPWSAFDAYSLSRRASSTTPAPFRSKGFAKIRFFCRITKYFFVAFFVFTKNQYFNVKIRT